MNRRQAKKLYKKLHGHNPPKGKIPAVLLRNPNKIQKRSENNMINECVGMRAWRKSLRGNKQSDKWTDRRNKGKR